MGDLEIFGLETTIKHILYFVIIWGQMTYILNTNMQTFISICPEKKNLFFLPLNLYMSRIGSNNAF